MRYTNGKPRKTLRFPVFTPINLPGKCVYYIQPLIPVNTLSFTQKNANEQNENKLFTMRYPSG